MFPNVTERVNKKCFKKRIIIWCPGNFFKTIDLTIIAKAKASMNFYYIFHAIDNDDLLSDLIANSPLFSRQR